MNKILKPYTIIPSDLYVERDADRQIREIILDGGRPGYVLVARQMGKTNLLLHAKKMLESEKTLITYIDLSNKFENERDCFRNIIDITIETHESQLGDILDEFYQKRKSTHELPPHKEHERELRYILDKVDKLVIVLDEVDALTATSYSDRIFAQIRSIYFTRTNFPIFNKLTYVLSGVAEPSEIIKDKNISPFNIGQKIYLDDFNRAEIKKFLEKSSLSIPYEIENRIYFWTNGNPRMTWEIATKVEDLLKLKSLTTNDIDMIVNEQYLEKGDLPPIDHIKNLVEANQYIRNSIMSIHYGKGNTLSQHEKTKLYLAGIINSDFSSETLNLKNEILKKALSIEWLEEIERSKTNFYDIGAEKLNSNNYIEAIHYFETYLKESEGISKDRLDATNLQLALCYYRAGNYKKALQAYEITTFSKDGFRDLYFENMYHRGLCYLAMSDYQNAIPLFSECALEHTDTTYRLRSKLNWAGCLFYFSFKDNSENIIRLNQEIVEESKNSQENKDILFIRVNALFNLGYFYQTNDDLKASNKMFEDAIEHNLINTLPAILLNYSRNFKETERVKYLGLAVQKIIENHLLPKRNILEAPIEFNEDVLKNILLDLITFDPTSFENLFSYTLNNIYKNIKPHEVLKLLATKAEDMESIGPAAAILSYSYDRYSELLTIEERHYDLKFLCIFGKESRRSIYHNEYLKLFENNSARTKIDELDFRVFSDLIINFLNQRDYFSAQKIINKINSLKKEVNEDQQINYLMIDIFEINSLRIQLKEDMAFQKAQIAYEKIRQIRSPIKSFLISQEQFKSYEQFLEKFILEHSATKRKIGRNDYVEVRNVKTNMLKITKYKKVEEELSQGECVLIRIVDKS